MKNENLEGNKKPYNLEQRLLKLMHQQFTNKADEVQETANQDVTPRTSSLNVPTPLASRSASVSTPNVNSTSMSTPSAIDTPPDTPNVTSTLAPNTSLLPSIKLRQKSTSKIMLVPNVAPIAPHILGIDTETPSHIPVSPKPAFHFASDSDDDDSKEVSREMGCISTNSLLGLASNTEITSSHTPMEIPGSAGGSPEPQTIPHITATQSSPLPEDHEKLMRQRASTNSSKNSQASSTKSQKSSSSTEDIFQKKLGKFAFWKTSDSESQKNKPHLGPPINIPPMRKSSVATISATNTSIEMNTVPFPPKRESSSNSFNDISRFFFDNDKSRRRKTNESEARSRSSSLGLGYTSYAHRKRQAAGFNSLQGDNGATFEPVSGNTPTTSLSSMHNGGGTSSLSSNGLSGVSRPNTLLRSMSSDDVRNRRVLPLPPPPTIGVGNVMEDPDVKALKLDPMAVRYADQLHMLGYTRNRHVCAILSKESNKEKAKYNMMVMEAFIMRMMHFHGEPIDMSLRKFLYKMVLPQESQQIERQLQCFSILWNYHNPGIFIDEEHVLCVVYSLVMLHTATFNKNIKQKMSKVDFVRNSPLDGLVPEIFEYFYDNITATPFKSEEENAPVTPVHYHSAHPITVSSPLNHLASPNITTTTRSASTTSNPDFYNDDLMVPPNLSQLGQFDSPTSLNDESHSTTSRRSPSFIWQKDHHTNPYTCLLENRLDELRSTLPSFDTEPTLSFCEIKSRIELDEIRNQLEGNGSLSLQVTTGKSKTSYVKKEDLEEVSMSTENPNSVTQSGLVDIPVVKYGVVLRREYKRTLGVGEPKPGWREWGLLLTASKLYMFKSASFIRQLENNESQKVHVSLEMLNSAKTMTTRDIAALVKVVRPPTPRTSHSSVESPNSDTQHLNSSPPTSSLMHMAAGPRGTDVFDFLLIDSGRDTASQYFAVHTEEELQSWVRSINVIAAQSTLNIGLLKSWPNTPEQLYLALDYLKEQIESVQVSVNEHKRTLEHFHMLTPLQQRTREQLVFTAGRYTSRLDDSLAEMSRLKAYENILEIFKSE